MYISGRTSERHDVPRLRVPSKKAYQIVQSETPNTCKLSQSTLRHPFVAVTLLLQLLLLLMLLLLLLSFPRAAAIPLARLTNDLYTRVSCQYAPPACSLHAENPPYQQRYTMYTPFLEAAPQARCCYWYYLHCSCCNQPVSVCPDVCTRALFAKATFLNPHMWLCLLLHTLFSSLIAPCVQSLYNVSGTHQHVPCVV
jgi:hypothetical protein